jgi:hypothetical protein
MKARFSRGAVSLMLIASVALALGAGMRWY